MDTKSRNIRYSPWIKLLAALVSIAGMLLAFYGLTKAPYYNYLPNDRDQSFRTANLQPLERVADKVYQTRFIYKSEENIRSGNTLKDSNVRYYEESNLRAAMNNNIAEINRQYGDLINEARENGSAEEVTRLSEEQKGLVQQEREQYDKSIAELKDRLIRNQLNEYHTMLQELQNTNGILYYAKTPEGKELTNAGTQSDMEKYFKSLPSSWLSEPGVNTPLSVSGFYVNIPAGGSLYVGMSQERYDRELQTFQENYNKALYGIYQTIAGLLVFLLGFLYLLYAAGRRPETEGIHLLPIDRLYTDIGLTLTILLVGLCFPSLNELWMQLLPGNPTLFYVLGGLLVAAGTTLFLAYMVMAAKRWKRKELLRNTLIFSILFWMWTLAGRFLAGFRKALNGGPATLRIILLFLAYAFAVFLSLALMIGLASSGRGFGFLIMFLLFAAVNLAALRYVLKKATAFKDILRGTERVKAGEMAYRIPVSGGTELSTLAQNINNIAEGLKDAVESEVKAERLKAELVTNVSHDLKTPLTSIITYIDLLKTEGLQSENAGHYLEVLEQKAQRLKTLTNDLFEAAKAASGSIAVNPEKLDVGALVTQGLGEISEKITQANLDFRVGIPTEKLYVLADGRLLWRVLENLLSNVLKYALPGSRVYIDAAQAGNKVIITLKNISAVELNTSADELLERFKRGDQSRHSEGSGLGLSIAKSLTELQGGTFRVDVDGDLFKATVTLSAS